MTGTPVQASFSTGRHLHKKYNFVNGSSKELKTGSIVLNAMGRFRYWIPHDLLHPKEGFRDHLRSQVHRRPIVINITNTTIWMKLSLFYGVMIILSSGLSP